MDLLSARSPEPPSLERALTVARYKTATYTVERPLHLVAVLAGASPSVTPVLSAFALPLGETFQLRDDLVGVFGDPLVTGVRLGQGGAALPHPGLPRRAPRHRAGQPNPPTRERVGGEWRP